MQYSLNKDLQHHKWQQKSHGCHIQTARVRNWRSICLYPGQNGRCSKIIKKSQIGMSRHFDSSTTTQMAKIMVQYGRSSRSSWKEFVRSSFGKTVMEKQFEKSYCSTVGKKFPIGNACSYTVKKGYSDLCLRMTWKLAGKKQNLNPMWKLLNNEFDLGEATSFLDHVYLGCTQRQCEISKDFVDKYRAMFQSRISAGETEKLPYSENFRISSWSYDMEGHAKKCVERYCELANKTTQQLCKMSTPCIDDHHLREEVKSVGELSQVCSQIVLKCWLILGTNWKTWYSMVSV